MVVHVHTPDCRHSTDKPAGLDSSKHFSTLLQRNLEHGFGCDQRIAPIYRNQETSGHVQCAYPLLQVKYKNADFAGVTLMMNFLGQMQGICLTQMPGKERLK
jgi:hypothetical protein